MFHDSDEVGLVGARFERHGTSLAHRQRRARRLERRRSRKVSPTSGRASFPFGVDDMRLTHRISPALARSAVVLHVADGEPALVAAIIDPDHRGWPVTASALIAHAA